MCILVHTRRCNVFHIVMSDDIICPKYDLCRSKEKRPWFLIRHWSKPFLSIGGSIPSNEINTAPNYITQKHLHKDIKCARFLSKYDQYDSVFLADFISLLPLVDRLTISANSSSLLLILLSSICQFSPLLSFKMATCWRYICAALFLRSLLNLYV